MYYTCWLGLKLPVIADLWAHDLLVRLSKVLG